MSTHRSRPRGLSWALEPMIALHPNLRGDSLASSTRKTPTEYRLLLGSLGLAAFLTQVRFIPMIKNNVGPFELVGGVLIAVFVLFARTESRLLHPPPVRVLAAILFIGLVSQINIPDSREMNGLVNVTILAFLYLFLLVTYNLIRQYQIGPDRLLIYVCRALLVVGPWILYQGIGSTAAVQEVGPFRNRAHMGSYMLTAFWMALMLAQWPGIRKRERIVAYAGIAMTLYAIAVSGRRSVYLSLFIGLTVLAIAFLAAQRGKRASFFVTGAFAVAILVLLYQYGPSHMPQLAFFKERVGMIDDRLDAVLAVSEDEAREESFFALQRAGVRMAFTAHPFVGIGWGGFAKSHYSPTGHEVHSTPLRFLAETGLIGLALYAALLFVLLKSVAQSFFRARGTPFANSFLVLGVGLSSLVISYLYNRHVTERTFWLLLVVIVASDLHSRRLRAGVRSSSTRAIRGAGPTRSGNLAARERRHNSRVRDGESPWPASST